MAGTGALWSAELRGKWQIFGREPARLIIANHLRAGFAPARGIDRYAGSMLYRSCLFAPSKPT